MDQLTRVAEELVDREPRPWLNSYPADVPAMLTYPEEPVT